MAEYLAFRIMEGALDYTLVISKRPDLKNQIDTVLVKNNKGELIV